MTTYHPLAESAVRASAPHEGEQRGEVATVGSSEGNQVVRARVGRACEITTAPGESRLMLGVQKHVGHQARPAAVSVGPRVNEHELVVKPRGDLVELVNPLGTPECCVVKALTQRNAHMARGHTDVLARPSIGARPHPRLAEHAAMELRSEVGREDSRHTTTSARHRPAVGSRDVEVLPFVDLGLGGDVPWPEALNLIRIEGCSVCLALRPCGRAPAAHFGRVRLMTGSCRLGATTSGSHRWRGVSALASARWTI